MNQKEQSKTMGQIVAKCWADEGFKRKLLSDPAATLRAEGVEFPAGLSIKALENTDRVFHLVIPAKPAELTDQELEKVAGGIAVSDPGSETRCSRCDSHGKVYTQY